MQRECQCSYARTGLPRAKPQGLSRTNVSPLSPGREQKHGRHGSPQGPVREALAYSDTALEEVVLMPPGGRGDHD